MYYAPTIPIIGRQSHIMGRSTGLSLTPSLTIYSYKTTDH